MTELTKKTIFRSGVMCKSAELWSMSTSIDHSSVHPSQNGKKTRMYTMQSNIHLRHYEEFASLMSGQICGKHGYRALIVARQMYSKGESSI